MSKKSLRAIAIALIGMALFAQGLPIVPASVGEPGSEDGSELIPVEDPSWHDDLDDDSMIYIPPGGLVGIEISNGAARLLPSHTEGWLASSIIKCPPGFRYDLVILEVDAPGNSRVEVSILDATSESSEVGYANETIPNFKRLAINGVVLGPVAPASFPEIRIQVNLVADAGDRPALLSWSLRYVPKDTWRDDFIGPWKMTDIKGLNLTGGKLSIDLSGTTSMPGGGDYEAFPPLIVPSYTETGFFYPNTGRTGYQDRTTISTVGGYGAAVADFDHDGNLDVVITHFSGGTKILWGTESGTWTETGAVALNTQYAQRAAVGDFNADGEMDIVIPCYTTSTSTSSLVFLNQGGGSFNSDADVEFTDEMHKKVSVGDLDGDGIDDILLVGYYGAKAWFGGIDGLDTTADITFSTNWMRDGLIEDLDGDGWQDVALVDASSSIKILYGEEGGPDIGADLSLIPGGTLTSLAAGDINGDEFIDIMYSSFVDGGYKVTILKGSSSDWSTTNYVRVDYGWVQDTTVADINKDGFDDILTNAYISPDYKMLVILGSATWPTGVDITKASDGWYDMAVAIPPGGSTRGYGGILVSDEISMQPGKRWDILSLDGTLPLNTTVHISILDGDGDPIYGFENLEDLNIDLSGITLHQTIRVKVVLRSEFNYTTPDLDNLVVKWMDENMWRDEFYGGARVDKLLNMDLRDLSLRTSAPSSDQAQMVFSLIREKAGPGTLSLPVIPPIKYTSGVDVADANGDGYNDVAYSQYMKTQSTYEGKSALFLGRPVGFRSTPDHEFPTTGATDILLEDINGDGHVDVVIAQEQDGSTYSVPSLLFWGRQGGWNDTADVEFSTTGATGVEAVDIDGDGRTDLAFSCYKSSSTSTDSMVFLQHNNGFCETVPDHGLGTKGAKAVASGDIDGDGHIDLVFANSFSAGYTEIDSYIFWGKDGGGFETDPSGVPTKGAVDVQVADVDGDGHLDLVFANHQDNNQDDLVDSAVFLGDGTRSLPTSPSHTLTTHGAMAVAVGDMDGQGWMDLVFACAPSDPEEGEGSRVFLSTHAGWDPEPTMIAEAQNASDVKLERIVREGQAGYLSKTIQLDPTKVGALHTLTYSATVASSVEGRIAIVDSETLEEVVSTELIDGTHDWDLREAFKLKEHNTLKVMVALDGIVSAGDVAIQLISFNWTDRVFMPPVIRDLQLSSDQVYRTQLETITLDIFDEFDPAKDLQVTVNSRLNGTDEWAFKTVSKVAFEDGHWIVEIRPRIDASLGLYDYRVRVRDTDNMLSQDYIYEGIIQVLNNPPTRPKVQLGPSRPVSTSTLVVELVTSSSDIESNGLTYIYRWYRDGQLMDGMTNDSIPEEWLNRGENWTVEVSAFDGDDEGPRGTAWVIIQNAHPVIRNHLPDPQIEEDHSDMDWLDLSTAFEDPDGDDVTWSLGSVPEHVSVTIGPGGEVTIVPETNWNGQEEVIFVCSDGDLQVSQAVTITVLPVNDLPQFIAVDGNPIVSDPVTFTIQQGGLLVIDVTVLDVEGDELVFSVNTSAVEVNDRTGEIRFQPGMDEIGTLRFGLKVYDLVSPDRKVPLNFSITIENENDPMDDPIITHPYDGDSYKVNITFYMSAECYDPDVQFGQVLNYTWTSSISGLLGYGSTLSTSIPDPGDHVLTLTVTDGEFQKTTFINLEVKPKEIVDPEPGDPDPDPTDNDDGGPFSMWMLILALVVLGAAGAAGYLAITRGRDDEDEIETAPIDEREALEQISKMAKEAADALEESKNGDEEDDLWVETETKEGIEVDSAELSDTRLSMEVKVTKAASSDVQALFADIESNGFHASEEDTEQLRLDTMKRKYQNAIGKLPYGIPSKALRGREWTDLAAALTTGEKKVVDGREVTDIDGRWYYSDHKDSSTFLKEHGAKPKESKPKVTTTDKDSLLAKLEERFILGEISEETYRELKEKYADD